MKKTAVKVMFSDGDSIITEMSAPPCDVLNYYRVGNVFNLGIMSDHLVKVVSAEILHTDWN